jgi:hypothetical protein
MRRSVSAVLALLWVGPPAAAESAPATPPTFRLSRLPSYVVEGVGGAVRTLGRDGRPFTGSLQTIAHLHESRVLLAFIQQEDAPSVDLPEVCAVWTAPLRLCELAGEPCAVIEKGMPDLVVCNYDFAAQLDYLIAVNHDTARLRAVLSSDRAFMDTLATLPSESSGFPSRVSAQLSHDHLVNHWLGLMTFILNHEAYHLRVDAGPPSESPPTGANRPLDRRRLEAELYCRIYREFARDGWTLYPSATPTKLRDEHKDIEGSTGSVLRLSLTEWSTEREADQEGLRALLEVLALIEKSIGNDARLRREFVDTRNKFIDETIRDLAMIGLMSWYQRMSRFIDGVCPEVRFARFPLTRCMCAHRSRFEDARILLDESHPPLLLRVWAMTGALLAARNDPERSESLAFHQMLQGLLDGALKVPHVQCLLGSLDGDVLTPDARIFQLYPAIEGLVEPGSAREAPGYPTFVEVERLRQDCLPKPK